MTSPTTSAGLAPLSRQLREGTASEHEHAESGAFIRAVMDGSIPREGIVDLWAQYRYIYEDLEAAGTRLKDDPIVGQFVVEALLRCTALDTDLEALAGSDWRDYYPPTDAALRYCERLRTLEGPTALGFIAHHYTRYLGDLAGGQAIGQALLRRTDLGVDALAFPTFDQIESRPQFREQYRAWLDGADLNADQQAAVVAEARVVFELNAAVFDDLGSRHLATNGTPA